MSLSLNIGSTWGYFKGFIALLLCCKCFSVVRKHSTENKNLTSTEGCFKVENEWNFAQTQFNVDPTLTRQPLKNQPKEIIDRA